MNFGISGTVSGTGRLRRKRGLLLLLLGACWLSRIGFCLVGARVPPRSFSFLAAQVSVPTARPHLTISLPFGIR